MSENGTTNVELTRRQICKAGALALAGLAWPTTLPAATSIAEPAHSLSFYNTHTSETLHDATYRKNGSLQPDALYNIYNILRDHRSDEITRIDLKLLDQLTLLNRTLDNSEPLHIISGFRSPQTNAYLRKMSPGGGVAKYSLHMNGRAIDFRIPGFDINDLYNAAVSLKAGGVGLYPGLKFVHIDTGAIKYWSG